MSKKLAHILKCEICDLNESKALERHHMIPSTDPNSTNDESNLAVVCGSCHNLIHANQIILEGRYSTSKGPKLFWHRVGEPFVVIPGIILNKDGTATVIRS